MPITFIEATKPAMTALEGIELNVFQRAALQRVLGSRFGLVQLPTGCGKTRLAAAAIRLLRGNGLLSGGDVVLVLSPRLVIREQIRREMEAVLGKGFMVVEVDSGEKLQNYLTLASTIGANSYLLVATPQLLVSAERRGLLQAARIAGLVLDEAHHTYTGDETSRVIEGLVRRVVDGGGFAIGLTATPTREALKLLGGSLLYSALSAYAMAEGVLVGRLTIRYTETKFECPPDVDPWRYEVPQRAEAYSKKILEALGGKVSCKVLVVAPNVSEADMLRDRLVEMMENDARALVRTAHYREEDPIDVIRWFRDTDRGILITVNMADIGFDVPDLEVLVLARRFTSPVAYTQVRGRVLRKPPNTEAGVRKAANGAVLVDLAGSSLEREPMVPAVELGQLQEGYEAFYSDLRGFHPIARRDIQTQVGELRDVVLDAAVLKVLEEPIIRSLTKKPRPLERLVASLVSAGVSQPRDAVSAACTILKLLGVVEGEANLRVPPENAVAWLALREGADAGGGWVSVSKARVEGLLGDSSVLSGLMAQYKPLFRDGGEKLLVYVADWRRLVDIGRDLSRLNRKFMQLEVWVWPKLVRARRLLRRCLAEHVEGVDLHLKVRSDVLFDEARWLEYAKGRLGSALQRLKSGARLVIRLTVHGQRVEADTAAKLLFKALSPIMNTEVKVLVKGRREFKLGLEEAEETYTRFLEECRLRAGEAGKYSELYNELIERTRESLAHISRLNIMYIDVFVKLA
jgi:superfamily II DNA or RNA helicase